tara:strand:+ start:544 stop:1218 length:675 start_codon:yes stop_codon:yes gene_type:complete
MPYQGIIEWTNYLSQSDRADITRKIVEARIRELQKSGELESAPDHDITVTVSGTISPLEGGPDGSTGSVSAQAFIPVGNFDCDINVQQPHPGSGPNGPNHPKAKSSGTCKVKYVGPGPMPTTIGWELRQYLSFIPYSGGFNADPITYDETHLRAGFGPDLSASWNPTTATVFATCVGDWSGVPGTWFHTNYMFVIPPPGWTVNPSTPNPFELGSPVYGGIFDGC